MCMARKEDRVPKMQVIWQWQCHNHACNDPTWYSRICMHRLLLFFFFFQKNYMSKKANWDFLKLVQGRYYYSSLMGWLGSQAGSWDPRKYPSQIPSQLPRKSHIYLTHLLSNNSLIFYLIDSNSKLGYKVCGLPGACFEISEKWGAQNWP